MGILVSYLFTYVFYVNSFVFANYGINSHPACCPLLLIALQYLLHWVAFNTYRGFLDISWKIDFLLDLHSI